MANLVMTAEEVAELLRVHFRTVHRMAGRGELPGFKVAGSWRFERKDVEEWIEQQKGRTAARARKR